MQTESNHDMQSWIQKKNPDKYVSVQVQNDALKLMANQFLRNVMKDLESVNFLTLMADETTDISHREQLIICLQYIDDQFVHHDIFVGFY